MRGSISVINVTNSSEEEAVKCLNMHFLASTAGIQESQIKIDKKPLGNRHSSTLRNTQSECSNQAIPIRNS
jgi:hypothetical protein